MIQGILCFRIDCCGHEIAGSDDGTVNLGAHTFGPSREHKRTKRGARIVTQCLALCFRYNISQRSTTTTTTTCVESFHVSLFPFPNIPFTNRFRKFSTVICRKDEGPREFVILQDIVPNRILAPTFSHKIPYIYDRKMHGTFSLLRANL